MFANRIVVNKFLWSMGSVTTWHVPSISIWSPSSCWRGEADSYWCLFYLHSPSWDWFFDWKNDRNSARSRESTESMDTLSHPEVGKLKKLADLQLKRRFASCVVLRHQRTPWLQRRVNWALQNGSKRFVCFAVSFFFFFLVTASLFQATSPSSLDRFLFCRCDFAERFLWSLRSKLQYWLYLQ